LPQQAQQICRILHLEVLLVAQVICAESTLNFFYSQKNVSHSKPLYPCSRHEVSYYKMQQRLVA